MLDILDILDVREYRNVLDLESAHTARFLPATSNHGILGSKPQRSRRRSFAFYLGNRFQIHRVRLPLPSFLQNHNTSVCQSVVGPSFQPRVINKRPQIIYCPITMKGIPQIAMNNDGPPLRGAFPQ